MKISSLKTIIHTQRLIWKWLYNFNVLFFTTAVLEMKLLFLDVTDFPRVLENSNIIILRTVLNKIDITLIYYSFSFLLFYFAKFIFF